MLTLTNNWFNLASGQPGNVRKPQKGTSTMNMETTEQLMAVELITRGEFVRRKEGAKKTYQRCGYDRKAKAYCLLDCDDQSREIFVKPGTQLFVGFDY